MSSTETDRVSLFPRGVVSALLQRGFFFVSVCFFPISLLLPFLHVLKLVLKLQPRKDQKQFLLLLLVMQVCYSLLVLAHLKLLRAESECPIPSKQWVECMNQFRQCPLFSFAFSIDVVDVCAGMSRKLLFDVYVFVASCVSNSRSSFLLFALCSHLSLFWFFCFWLRAC